MARNVTPTQREMRAPTLAFLSAEPRICQQTLQKAGDDAGVITGKVRQPFSRNGTRVGLQKSKQRNRQNSDKLCALNSANNAKKVAGQRIYAPTSGYGGGDRWTTENYVNCSLQLHEGPIA